MIKSIVFLILFSITVLTSCDPKTYGTITFVNYSNQNINVRYKGHFVKTDTSIQVKPNQSAKLLIIDHWGNPKKYECCPCEFDSLLISPIDTSMQIIKDIKSLDNWIKDKSKMKIGKNHQVDCSFELYSRDIK